MSKAVGYLVADATCVSIISSTVAQGATKERSRSTSVEITGVKTYIL